MNNTAYTIQPKDFEILKSEMVNDSAHAGLVKKVSAKTETIRNFITDVLDDTTFVIGSSIAIADQKNSRDFPATACRLSYIGEDENKELDEVIDQLKELGKTLAAGEFGQLTDDVNSFLKKGVKEAVLSIADKLSSHSSFTLDPIESIVINNLNDSFIGPINDAFEKKIISTKAEYLNPGDLRTSERTYTLANSLLTNYYRLFTVVTANPINSIPPIFMMDLIDRYVMDEDAIKNNRIYQYLTVEDKLFACDFKELDASNIMPANIKFDSKQFESHITEVISTTVIGLDVQQFSDPLERMHFARCVELQKHALIAKLEERVSGFVLSKLKETAITVATGDLEKSALGTNPNVANPSARHLSGIAHNGTKNGTLSEIDLVAALSAIDTMVSGSRITHMLMPPQAIGTVLYNIGAEGKYETLATSNVDLTNPMINAGGLNVHETKGLGLGKFVDPFQSPLLFGHGGSYDPNGVIPKIVNGMDPTTASFNLLTNMYKKFNIRVGRFHDITVVPYVDMEIRYNGIVINDQVAANPTIATNGTCKTDIWLLNKDRTALMVTTGMKPLLAQTNKDVFTTKIVSGVYERYAIYIKNHAQMYVISDVSIDFNYYKNGYTIVQ